MRSFVRHGSAPAVASRGVAAGAGRRANDPRAISILRRPLLVSAGVGAVATMLVAGKPPQALASGSQTCQRGFTTVEGQTIPISAGVVGFDSTSVQIGDITVPVAMWYPGDVNEGYESPTSNSNMTYPQCTSFSKIINTFLGLSLPVSLLKKDNKLESSPCVTQGVKKRMDPSQRAVVLAHGYLGSRFDLVHITERLAAMGFLVMAPEFGDARSGDVPGPSRRASSEGGEGAPIPTVSREEILSATLQKLQTEHSVPEDRIGLVGHSAGSGTISKAIGPFPRVSLAGFVPSADSRPTGPYLVVTSSGDSLITFQGGMPAVRAKLPGDFLIIDPMKGFLGAEDIPTAAALLLSEPNHISFLSERSNEAMLTTLGPLLPVARLLKLRLLDFDKYAESRDSRATAAVVIPAIERFLCYHLGYVPPAADGTARDSNGSTPQL